MHWRRKWQPTPLFLLGESQGRRSLVGRSPWGHEESDTAERLHFHFSLSCIGEGNGDPLQCSCLENPRDGGAWWAPIYGVAQSWTRLKRLSSSSSTTELYTQIIVTLVKMINFMFFFLFSVTPCSMWDRTCTPCMSALAARSSHWANREVPHLMLFSTSEEVLQALR